MTGVSSSCGACKFLRRRCTEECIFAPYFCYEEAATHFSAVHKVFGASNVSKLLSHLPVHTRSDAAITISYEALARMQDPIYGCVSHIFALYFSTESDMTSDCNNQLGLPNLQLMNEECCSYMELQYPDTSDEIFQGYLNSSIIDRLLEELSQDYYFHEELSHDYNLQSLWMKYAASQY